jgi:prohibitin 2
MNKLIAGLVIFVIVVLWLLSSVVEIGTGKVGIVTSFGKVTGRELDSGVNFKKPFPFESVSKYDVQVQKEQTDASASSQDLQDVKATLVVNYHLNRGSISELHRTVGTTYKERLIDPAIQESVKATTAKFPISELVTKRGELKDQATHALKTRLEKRGIVVDDISITNLTFSPEYTKAIEAKQVAQQNAERAQFTLQQAQLDAQAQQTQKESLTAEILQKMAIEKWNGVLPTVTGGATPFINVK